MKRWGEGRMGGSKSNQEGDESHFSQVAEARCHGPPHADVASENHIDMRDQLVTSFYFCTAPCFMIL